MNLWRVWAIQSTTSLTSCALCTFRWYHDKWTFKRLVLCNKICVLISAPPSLYTLDICKSYLLHYISCDWYDVFVYVCTSYIFKQCNQTQNLHSFKMKCTRLQPCKRYSYDSQFWMHNLCYANANKIAYKFYFIFNRHS